MSICARMSPLSMQRPAPLRFSNMIQFRTNRPACSLEEKGETDQTEHGKLSHCTQICSSKPATEAHRSADLDGKVNVVRFMDEAGDLEAFLHLARRLKKAAFSPSHF
jgi:hypothetical protein